MSSSKSLKILENLGGRPRPCAARLKGWMAEKVEKDDADLKTATKMRMRRIL
jgi:hypothetical protein